MVIIHSVAVQVGLRHRLYREMEPSARDRPGLSRANSAVVALVLLLPLARRFRLATPAPRRAPGDELVKDPVCRTYIVKSRAVRRVDAGGVRYFCSEQCARLDTGA